MSIEPHSAEASLRREVSRKLRDLHYGGSVQAKMPDLDVAQDEVDFLVDLDQWLVEYGAHLRMVSETRTNMAAELDELRRQRAAIRSFLGITRQDGELAR